MTDPRERPIIFNSWAVRAILDGAKCQTRRPVKPQPGDGWNPTVGLYCPTKIDRHGEEYPGPEVFGASDENEGRICQFGGPGERLWTKETWGYVGHKEYLYQQRIEDVIYPSDVDHKPCPQGFFSSLHMPRWASRITLEITSIRVERVQEISEEDAIAEGVGHGFQSRDGRYPDYEHINKSGVCELTQDDAVASFWSLWDSIYGAGAWESNPWVWAIEFRRITQ